MFALSIVLSVLLILYLIISKPVKDSLVNEPSSSLYWHLPCDLDHKNTFVPWEDILDSKLVEPKALTRYLQSETYTTQVEYDQSLDSYIRKVYPIIDLVFVHWRSPQESWDHLAGREGYVVISKTEKKQVDFIITVLS